MHHLGFLPCPTDLNLWVKPMVKSEDGFEYYAYVLIYVDDVMVIHHDTESVVRRIDKYFKLKPSLIGNTGIYLGSQLKYMQLENRVWALATIPSRYVKESLANAENYLDELADTCWNLPKKRAENPFIEDYALEMYETPTLEHDLASWYQSLIGILRCMVKKSRVDIITEVSIMASHMSMPR